MKLLLRYLLFLLTGIFMAGCASSNEPASPKNKTSPSSHYYTSAFPDRDVSEKLQSIRRSIKRISATAIYQTYFFDELLTFDELKAREFKKASSRTVTSNESTAGTAVSIAGNDRNIVLLTCDHVISFPDTLVSYFEGDEIAPKTFVKSVTIKRDQNNLIYDLPNIGAFEIVGTNEGDDLALLSVNIDRFNNLNAPPLPIKTGDPKFLRWGSMVYILGFPKGFPMITRGIVSDPNRSKDGDFLTDALFNPGISGGLILASRNNFSTFEWIGIANSASAGNIQILAPDPFKSYLYEPFEPYSDTIYVQRKTEISYGITQAIPMKRIMDFVGDHRRELNRLGLSIRALSR